MSDTPENNWLPVDLTGAAPTHLVTSEEHTVARLTQAGMITTNGTLKTIVIAPFRGCFYNVGLSVVFHKQSSGIDTELNSMEDYRLVGMDVGRTRVSSAKGGVYRFILITCDTSVMTADDSFYITYHAFGGELDSITYEDLLNNAGSGGSGGGGSEDTTARADITELQEQVGILARRMNYSPAGLCNFVLSNGTVTWQTIAESSDDLDAYIDLNDQKTTKGICELALFSSGLNAVFHLSYNIRKRLNNFECLLKCDTEYQQIQVLDGNEEISSNMYFMNKGMIVPMFRMMVRRSPGQNEHRIVIQMALLSNNTETYQCYIGDQTDLIMVPATGAADARAFRPWNTVWRDTLAGNTFSGTASDIESNAVLGLQDFYKIWDGNVSLSFIEDVSWTKRTIAQTYNVQNNLMVQKGRGMVLCPYIKGISVDAIKAFGVDIYDRYTETLIRAEITATRSKPYSTLAAASAYGCVNYFQYDNGILEILYTAGTTPNITLFGSSGANTYINKRFDLRAIYVK